jgi:hypothetical protein
MSTDLRTTRRTVTRYRRGIVALLLAACFVASDVPTASAWTSPTASGSYGGVTLRGVQGVTTYYREPGALYGSQVPALNVTGPVVSRSGATTGAQGVQFRYAVYQWAEGRWVPAFYSSTFVMTIPAGSSSVDFAPQAVRTRVAGYYRVTFAVTWRDGTGQVLGSRTFDYAHARDYTCRTYACEVGAGWMYV